jgi:hypothetical protein
LINNYLKESQLQLIEDEIKVSYALNGRENNKRALVMFGQSMASTLFISMTK